MNKLIIVRHGEYDMSGNLSARGRTQMRALAEKLRQVTGESRPKILASTAPRAFESAGILGELFGCEAVPTEILWSDNCRRTQIDAVLSLIELHQDEEFVILVTHYEYTEQLPSAFGRRKLGVPNFEFSPVEKGGAWVIDCEEKRMTLLAS